MPISVFVSIMGLSNLRIYILFSCLLVLCYSNDEQSEDFYEVDNFIISEKLGPYDSHYIRAVFFHHMLQSEQVLGRYFILDLANSSTKESINSSHFLYLIDFCNVLSLVKLPPSFFAMSLEIDPHDVNKIKVGHTSKLPVICFRIGSPPLPDFFSNVALEGLELVNFPNALTSKLEHLWNVGQCYALCKRIRIEFTSEQINRGSTYGLSTAVIVEGCKNQSMRGKFCNQTAEQLSCHQSLLYNLGQKLERIKMHSHIGTRLLTCIKYLKRSCHQDLNPKTYSLDVGQPAEELVILVSDFRLSRAQFTDNSGIKLMCYARYVAVPGNQLYDYAVDLSRLPLVISLPKIGTWYFNIQPVQYSNELEARQQITINHCHSLEWEVFECPDGKAGTNCTWERYMLQVVQRDNSEAFFVYMPKHVNMPVELHNLPLEPLLSNTSSNNESDFAWTYFVFDVPQGVSGKNIHIDLTGNTNINYELYVRFGGLPSIRDWDYFYINQTSNNANGSSMFKLYDLSESRVNAYLLYPREGLWSFALRHPMLNNPRSRIILSLSVENCPNQCSDHGTCRVKEGSSFYRYYLCNCDTRYGGSDCSTQLVSQTAQRWRVIFLTGSNAAALLPAVWTLHQKAFAEWVVFVCSGVASAIYHACDVDSWCVLPFQVLQFMDFWLSFMAVVSTFIYLAFINEASGRTIHSISSIVTALIAVNGPTKSRNIPLVLALGALGLLFAWLMKLCSARSNWNIHHRRVKVRSWFLDVLKALNKRFQWRYVFAGFISLSMAALSWNLENVETYWIWHSAWHVSIYTSAFFFLCSRSTINEAVVDDHARSPSVHRTSH